MRLTPAQVATIKSTTHAVLGEGAQVTLFGSRVHDALSRKKKPVPARNRSPAICDASLR